MKRTKSMVYNESVESHELALFAENTEQIYFSSILPTVRNLAKKQRKGIYDKEKAVDAFYHVATRASKLYEREFGCAFSVQERFTAACELESSYSDSLLDFQS